MANCESVRIIENTEVFGGRPGLSRIRAILNALGDPQRELKYVHVTGTNGKGSTAAMIEACLRAAGHKTGLFASPYVDDFRERIQSGGRMIPEADLDAALARVNIAVRRTRALGHMAPTQFELETAIALDYFARQGVDVAVVEVGVGGGHDCTNVIPAPECAVLTPISLDHTAALGRTAAEIAGEKCGIIKDGCPVVSAWTQPEDARTVIRARAGSLITADPAKLDVTARSIYGCAFTYGGLTLSVAMAGDHQIENAAVAAEVCRVLERRGIPIPDDAIRAGIACVRLPGRAEIARNNPTCILDGGHNAGAVAALCKVLDMLPADRRLIAVMGMFADKDYAACVEMIARRAGVFIASSSRQPRSLDPRSLASLASGFCPDCCWNSDMTTAVKIALARAGVNDVILVCGSIYNIHEARAALAQY